jgi:peptidoglycan/LPS O-acetylase OafA/YrhL
MCMLLTKSSPLDTIKVVGFYFRRIKRIVPLYLFLIIAVLLVALFLVAPAEYRLLFKEAWPSTLFCSNFIESNPAGYFNLVSRI